jgi:phosphate starvation-inducible protein PhoH
MTVATRIGKGSRMIFNGDDSQSDLGGRNGIHFLKQLLTGLDDVGVIQFVNKINERHPLITALIERKLQLDNDFNGYTAPPRVYPYKKNDDGLAVSA